MVIIMDANQDKLGLLLKEIKLPESMLADFESGCLKKIVCNKNRDSYRFEICLNSNLPLSTYVTFSDLLHKRFVNYKSITIALYVKEVNREYFRDYFDYIIDKYTPESPLIKMYKDSELNYEDNIVSFTVSNKAEKMPFDHMQDKFIKDLKSVGYDIDFEVSIDKKKEAELKAEIEDSLKVKDTKPVKKQSVVVMGETIKGKVDLIKDLIVEENNITVEGYVFADPDFHETKSKFVILTLKITDYTDSIYAKVFIKDEKDVVKLQKEVTKGNWYKFRGYTKNDNYSKELVLNIRDINTSLRENEKRVDDAPEKRIELHTHTMMSQMDGVVDALDLVKQAISWGHPGIAITDHNGVQAYPQVYNYVRGYNKDKENKFKVLYGTELSMIDDTVDIVVRGTDAPLLTSEYCVFDFETTGFNAAGVDSIIEIGAVKIKDGEILERYDELINPGRAIPKRITEVTNITTEMVKDKDNEENAIKRFIKWFGDLPMVAHNAKFDTSFLEMCYKKYNLGTFTNPVIDTLELSRTLDSGFGRHSLSAVTKRYNVAFDEESHHRGDYDAEATALVLDKMLRKANDRNFETIESLNNLVSKDEIYKYGREYHINIICKNKTGLKNLFKIVSYANTKYLYKTPRILRSEIERLREGLLIGSGCYNSEVFVEARSKSDEEMTNIIDFYDYVEVQPIDAYTHLLESGDFATKIDIADHITKIVKLTNDVGKIIVATGDVHYLNPDDKIYHNIIVNQKVPGGGRHPLARYKKENLPNNHFRTTNEMLEAFDFLDKDLAHQIVIDNPKKIADQVEDIEVIIDTGGRPFAPIIPNSAQITEDMVRNKAKELYGDPLPQIVQDRVDQELKGIINAKYDVIYLIAQKLVKKSNDDGYLVGSRGSVGSSFVATMMGITEVNPLTAHYRCPKCKFSIFDDENGKSLGATYASGFDLPEKKCPKCGTEMVKDGNDMPFATFLGFNADKVPDIDLNFSDLNQASAHNYTKVLFGEDNVYRAGTIGTVADKTAFGYVKGYCEENGITMRTAEVERLAIGCTGVKRTTGQHPGGIVVIPGYMDVFDFTPYQYPADDVNATWRTTHFDYHAIQDDVLKLDILGHSDPTQLRMLQDLSHSDVRNVPLGDKETMKIFLGPEPLGVTRDQIMCETGTLGIPEFGTAFTEDLVNSTKPTTFAELIKISGLSHGTDVWLGNAQELIKNKVVPFKDVIGCRDDIMVYLMYNGLEPLTAFKIMEFVRKGKASKDPETWLKYKDTMQKAGIADWFIDSCSKIKYMFPKAHATAYVISAFRIAWFKVHKPLWFYASWFSTKATDFDIESMIKGYDAIRARLIEIKNKGYDATNKEAGISESLQLALEATARGIKIGNIDLNKSKALYFDVDNETNTLIPPFRTLDGLGDTVAEKIVEEREKAPFLSIEDLQKRAKVSSTIIEKMRMMHILDGLDESSQLSLF